MPQVSPETISALLIHTDILLTYNPLPNQGKEEEQITNKLRSLLSTMGQKWNECVYQQMFLSTNTILDLRSLKKTELYFLKLENYLKKEAYSPCSWMSVRDELGRIVKFVSRQTDRLTRDMKESGGEVTHH
ncbi:interferon alpha-4-like [Pyxicephalus adspersus]|uniref:interferon alpha-4-like n=1 Tax=Pyxicephalus adspersus TaxID=30357 RepID=UPI003B5A7B74